MCHDMYIDNYITFPNLYCCHYYLSHGANSATNPPTRRPTPRGQPRNNTGNRTKSSQNRTLRDSSTSNNNGIQDNNALHNVNSNSRYQTYHGNGNNTNHKKNQERKRNDFPYKTTDFGQIDQLVEAAVSFPHLRPRDMSAIWNRISVLVERRAKKQSRLTNEFDTLLSRAVRDLPKCAPTQLSQLALSVAKITIAVDSASSNSSKHHQLLNDLLVKDCRKDDFFLAVATTAIPLLSKFEACDYSILSGAFAIVGANPVLCDGTSLLRHIAMSIVEMKDLSSFSPEQLSNTIWSMSKAEKELPSSLFVKVANTLAAHDLGSFGEQQLLNILLAFAASAKGPSNRTLFQAVAEELTTSHQLPSFTNQSLANIVFAFGTARISHVPLFGEVAEEVLSRGDLVSFNPQNLCMIAWAFATSKVSNTALFQQIADAAIARSDCLDSADVSILLWAFSHLGVRATSLFESTAHRVAELLDELNDKELTMIVWAYTVANVNAPNLFNSSFADLIVKKSDSGSFTANELSQLYQFHLWQNKELSKGIELPPTFVEKCHSAFTSQKTHASLYHKDVMSALLSLGLDPKEKVVTDKGFQLDACVEIDGKKAGVRVDGPHMFVEETPLGKANLRRRQVFFVEGIRLISIPHWEWSELSPRRQENYLRRQLGMN